MPPDDFFARNIEPRAQIVAGLLREGQLVALAGPFGVGKSPLLGDLVIHILNGMPWCGRELLRRPVIAFDFESDGPSYRKRLLDIASRLGVPPPAVPDDLDVYLEHDSADEPGTAQLLAAFASRGLDERMGLIQKALKNKPNAVVIIDPVELMFRFDTRNKMHVLAL